MLSFLTLIIAAAAIFQDAHSARILGLFPHTGKSHQMVFDPLLRRLTERGHHVTVVTFFPVKNPPANYTEVSLEGIAPPGIEAVDLTKYENPNKLLRLLKLEPILMQISDFGPLADMALGVCSKLVKFQPLADALKQEYDVVLVEHFNSDCIMGLAHVYGVKAPSIALLSSGLMHWSPDRIGVSYNPAYVPIISSSYTAKMMTFAERLENTLVNEYFKLWYRYSIQVKEQALIEKQFGMKIPDLHDLGKNITMMLVNAFHSLNGVRPLLPGIVEVGGMHLDHTRKPLPAHIERFLNESEHGVVLVSFGSLIKTASMPQFKEEVIMRALSKLNQRVIWKFEESGEEGTLEGNILKLRWIPQFELLQHPKVIAFMGHGGMLGMTEAISAGKPMLVVPFFGDQALNAAQATEIGFGKAISYADITEQSLYDGLQYVLSAEMRVSARKASKIWQDRQNNPLDTAVYWTERVIRWGNSDPLHSPARDMPFYQIALLDVVASVAAVFLVLLAILRLILRQIVRLFSSSKPSRKEKMH